MITFQINDMTCGHCAATISKTLAAADPDAKLAIDVEKRLVGVESKSLDASRLQALIAGAGYSPVPVDSHRATAAGKAGCGCGC